VIAFVSCSSYYVKTVTATDCSLRVAIAPAPERLHRGARVHVILKWLIAKLRRTALVRKRAGSAPRRRARAPAAAAPGLPPRRRRISKRAARTRPVAGAPPQLAVRLCGARISCASGGGLLRKASSASKVW